MAAPVRSGEDAMMLVGIFNVLLGLALYWRRLSPFSLVALGFILVVIVGLLSLAAKFPLERLILLVAFDVFWLNIGYFSGVISHLLLGHHARYELGRSWTRLLSALHRSN
jgi:hypothetical protein